MLEKGIVELRRKDQDSVHLDDRRSGPSPGRLYLCLRSQGFLRHLVSVGTRSATLASHRGPFSASAAHPRSSLITARIAAYNLRHTSMHQYNCLVMAIINSSTCSPSPSPSSSSFHGTSTCKRATLKQPTLHSLHQFSSIPKSYRRS